MSVKKNLAFNMLYQVLNMIVPLVTAPYLARVVGAEGTGIFSYYYSVAGYFVLFGMVGMNNYGNRSIAMVRDNKDKLSKEFWEIYSVQFVTALLSLAIYILFAMSIHSQERIVVWINILYVISGVFDINWFFFGMEQFKWTSIRSATVKIISLVAILVFVKKKEDLYIYILISAGSILISQLVLWPRILKMIKFEQPEWSGIKKHIKPSMILFIPVVAVSLYKMMDKVMLGLLSSRVKSGLYENAEKIINIPIVFINALGTVMLPKMSNLIANGEFNRSKIYIRDSMQFIMALALPISMGTAAVAENFAPLFFGEEFRACGILIMCLSPITVFNSWANVLRTQYLIPNKRDREYTVSVIVGAVFNVLFNSILITKIGALGAVIGTLIAEFSVMLVQTMSVTKELEISTYLKDCWIFVVSGLSMYVVVFKCGGLFGENVSSLILQILIGIAIYGGLTLTLFIIFQRNRLIYMLNMIKISDNGGRRN